MPITEGDCKAGFVLSGIGTNELHDFSPNEDAVVNEDWRKFGAGRDWFYLALDSWRFPVGTNEAERLRIFSNGEVNPLPGLTNSLFAPFLSDLHVLPEERWEPCRFWHSSTPSNTVVLTWQNVFLNRSTNSPASFQMEMWPNGNFVYRYDLSRTGLWDGNAPSNITVGAMHDGISRTVDVSSLTNLTSLHFHHLDPADLPGSDRDGDGLSVEDEIFVHRTDPGLWDTDLDGISDGEEAAMGCNPKSRDTDGDAFCDGTDPHPAETDPWDDGDGDSLPDSWKVHWFGSNAVSAAGDENQDGISNLAALMMGISPVKQCDGGFAVDNQGSVPEINAWEIAPSSFSFQRPPMLTNLIVRTFTIARQSPWEQFFISSRPDCAAGWSMEGVELSYGIDREPPAQSVPPCVSDSWRLDFGEGMPHTVTVRLVATGPQVSLSAPLYLLRWSPRVEFRPSALVHTVASTNGHIYAAAKRDSSTGLYSILFSVDVSRYPHRGGMETSAALDLALPPAGGISVTNIPHLAFTSENPVLVDLPREGTNLSKRILCYSVSFENATAVEPGPRASKYESPYPLDRTSLRVAYHKASDKESKSAVALVLKPSVPELSFRKAAAKAVRSMPLARTGGDDDGYEFFPPFSGWPEVGGDPCTNDTYDVDFEYPENHDSTYPEEDEEDEDDDCECGCDGGSSLGSFRLRIPLGESAHNEISGFLWTSINGPAEVSPELFNVLSAPGITVMTNSDRSIEVVNTRLGGKSLSVTNIANGVDIPVWDADGKFEARWEVVNEDGNIDSFRVRKMTVLGNATEDVTYRVWEEYLPEVFGDVPEDLPVVVWERVDNLRGLSKRRYELRDEYESDFVLKQYEETYLDGNLIRAVLTDYIKIGIGESACRRVGSVNGYDEYGWYGKTYTYWCDTDNKDRHGRLRSFCSDREPWYYCDYDSQGRETVRIEQLDGSAFAELQAISLDAPLDEYTSVKVTLTDYAPQDGDSAYRNDSCKPRSIKTYVRKNGKSPILVSQETYVYERDVDSDGIAVCRQIRRSGFGDAVRTVASVSYAEDSSVPKYLRGLPVSVVDDAGVLTETAYSLSNGCLIATSRPSFNGREKDTFTKTTTDAAYRLPLKEKTCLSGNGVCIGWTSRSYDSQRRLRSVRYSDGTCETNAYSCCRLLWRQDREGRKTLRSAKTGNDHLYYAEEEVWLADVSTNGQYRITQHFFDGLGRETNTVVCVGTVPGEAVESDFNRVEHVERVERKTEYPYGGSDYAVTTDERGKVVRRQENHYGTQEEVVEIAETNGVEVLRSATVKYRNGGSSTRREWLVGRSVPTAPQEYAWTEERRFTDYAADGKRIDYVVTESSDSGIVTNSVSTYDLLGRPVEFAVPGVNGSAITTVYTYDGTTSRKLTELTTGSPLISYEYDAYGNLSATIQDGKSIRNTSTYETIDGEVYRVTARIRMTGSVTNSVQYRKQQLTGLSSELRSKIISSASSGRVTTRVKSLDVATGCITETSQTEDETPVTIISRYGIPQEQSTIDGKSVILYDALGREAEAQFYDTGAETPNRIEVKEYDISGNVIRTLTDLMDGRSGETLSQYDTLNREVRRIDIIGHVTEMRYDALGRTISVGGDTYPLKSGYDTQGRKISGSTTRDNGLTWDETNWEFDAASGVNTAKVYADGTRIVYNYTDNGKKTRTTWARGVWKENAYSERNLVSGTTYSDSATPSVAYTYSDAGKMVSASLSDGTAYSYDYDNRLLNTAENITIAGEEYLLPRTYDDYRRNVNTSVAYTNVHYAAKTMIYDSENRVCGYAFTNATGRGVTVNIAYNGSYQNGIVYTLPNGNTFTVEYDREAPRKHLAINRRYRYGNQQIYSYATEYDLLERPVNAIDSLSTAREWLYNNRNELALAVIGTNSYAYAYDSIGNREWSASNSATNSYIANSLNQYSQVDASQFVYDADGNLTQDDRYNYTYDAENRLVSVIPIVPTEGLLSVHNRYNHNGLRIRKIVKRYTNGCWSNHATHTFIFDGGNIVLERIAKADGNHITKEYFWGIDKSGSEQGAGGVGGLLAESVNGIFSIPCYDHNGNIVAYVSETGGIEAFYVYDAYGNTIEKSGENADVHSFGFSTKYHDREVGLIGYQKRFYCPDLGRWLNRDPIGEGGGLNLYRFCGNNPAFNIDLLGEKVVVIKHLPGTKPESNWTYADSLAETHWRYPSYTVSERRCAPKKIGFTVTIDPPTIVIHVYFRSLKDSIFEMHKEQQHIDAIVRYDDALSKYKTSVEKICECPDHARTILAEESQKLTEAFYESDSYHNKLDAPGGQHGH